MYLSKIKSTLLICLTILCGHHVLLQGQSCLSFDGNTDHVMLPANIGQVLGASDFTFEAWINGLESTVSHSTILSNRISTNSGFHFFIHDYWGGSDHKMLGMRYNGSNIIFVDNGNYNGKLLDGDCHHVAVSKTQNVISLYIDGVLVGTRQNVVDINLFTNSPILIGNDFPSSTGFNGSINDVRIWNVARSQESIQEGMIDGVDPSSDGLLGYWELREGSGQTANDLTNQNHGFLGNFDSSDSADPLWDADCCNAIVDAKQCLSFDGSDRVAIPSTIGQSLGSNDFTFEANINGLESDISHGTILSNRTSTNSGVHLFIHDYWGGSNHKMLGIRYNGSNIIFVDNGNYNGKLLDGNCHHVAVTKTNSVISLYIDAILIGTRQNIADINLDTNAPLLIGDDAASNSGFNGSINDVRIWSVARSPEEIQEGIDNGVDPSVDGLLGYWEMKEGTGQMIGDLTNQHNGVLGNSNSSDSNDPSWTSDCCEKTEEFAQCLRFDGVNDKVTIPATVSESLGNNDFTFEAWVNGLENDIAHGTILSNRTSTNSGFHLFIHNYWGGSAHKMLGIRYNAANIIFVDNGNYNGKLLDGNCHHVAVTKTEGVISLYIDGVLIGTRQNVADINLDTNAPILIGDDAASNSGFNGTIDDVRIWNIARTQEEIEEGIENGVDPSLNGLLGYWQMKEGSGQVIGDLTNKNDAMLGDNSDADATDPQWGNLCCGLDIISDVDEELIDIPSITVFPNPSNGMITVDMGTHIGKNTISYNVIDVLGRSVKSGILSSDHIDLSALTSGQYWLRISEEQRIINTAKIVLIK